MNRGRPVVAAPLSGLTGNIYGPRYIDVISRRLDHHAGQLAALAHGARLAILQYIVQAGPEGSTTTELQEKLGIPWTTLNHHLDRLVGSKLVTARREGKFVYHTANYDALKELTDFIWEDCCKRGKGCC